MGLNDIVTKICLLVLAMTAAILAYLAHADAAAFTAFVGIASAAAGALGGFSVPHGLTETTVSELSQPNPPTPDQIRKQ